MLFAGGLSAGEKERESEAEQIKATDVEQRKESGLRGVLTVVERSLEGFVRKECCFMHGAHACSPFAFGVPLSSNRHRVFGTCLSSAHTASLSNSRCVQILGTCSFIYATRTVGKECKLEGRGYI